MREQWDKKRKRTVPPEERGWTSKSWGGRTLGPPDPIPGGMSNHSTGILIMCY